MRFLIGLITLALSFGAAVAADMPIKGPSQAIAAAPTANYWNGPYLSGGWGYGWGDSDPAVDVTNTTTKYKKSHISTESGSFTQRDSGALLGGGIGYDWRIMPAVVIGAEFEWNKAWIKGNEIYNTTQFTREIKSIGLITGRVGLLVDSLFTATAAPRNLIYVKGGGVWRNEAITATGELNGQTSNTVWGWGIGGGWEHVLDPAGRWRVRLEGMHAKFSDQNTAVSGIGSVSKYSTTTYAGNIKTSDTVNWFKVGVVWHPF